MGSELRSLIDQEHWDDATRVLNDNGVKVTVKPDPDLKVGLGFTEVGVGAPDRRALAVPDQTARVSVGSPVE